VSDSVPWNKTDPFPSPGKCELFEEEELVSPFYPFFTPRETDRRGLLSAPSNFLSTPMISDRARADPSVVIAFGGSKSFFPFLHTESFPLPLLNQGPFPRSHIDLLANAGFRVTGTL